MTRLDAVNYISHGIAKVPGGETAAAPLGAEEDEAAAENDVKKGSEALTAYCVNLNEKAVAGRIDPLIGRVAEVERTIQILCRRQKNNPLFVGESGVGKTAIAEGLARRIVEGRGARGAARFDDFRPRHGGAARRNPLPRRFRGAAEGGDRRARGDAGRRPVHRRDPHRDRCRGDVGRRHGRIEPAEAGARQRHDALHRLDHPTRNTATTSRRTGRSSAAFRRSTSTSHRSRTPSRSCAG